ncbi:MAG: hypothetical protein GY884_22360 [Proteobacteria bacterium]|nr:hypothetical protein [Pseudomonadota bacterium]
MFLFLAACVTNPANVEEDTWVYEPLAVCETDGLDYRPPVKPNMMLVVDRSGSMEGDSRWDQVMAMTPYLEAVEPASRLGLTLFPSPNGSDRCGVDDGIVVPIEDEPGAGAAILAELEGTRPDGATPVAESLYDISTNGRIHDPYRPNIVLLITDGQPNCMCATGDEDCEREAAITAVDHLVHGGDEPVQLYVIGSDIADARQTLEGMAEMAEDTTGDNYYEATNVEELVERFGRVTASLEPCLYALDAAVDDDDLRVSLNGVEVENCEDCDEGYTYDDATGYVELAPVSCRDALVEE